MTRATLIRLLRDANAPADMAKHIIGSPLVTYHIEDEAVVERLRKEAAKLNAVADRIERVHAGVRMIAERAERGEL